MVYNSSDESPAAENVRRLVEWSRRGDNTSPAKVESSIQSVGIIGAGVMGTEIAAAHVAHRMPVVVCDADQEVLAGAVAAIAAELRESQVEPSEDFLGLIRVTADSTEAARCDLVLEAIAETLPAKRRLFDELRGRLSNQTIAASNTSTIPIERLAEGVADASRFCGLHFLHPVRRRPLVEIVRGPCTADDVIAAVAAHARRLGKMPIVVRDGPGFLVNRLLFPYLGEALELLREGVAADVLERAALDFGMALGPLRLMDEIGLDTTLQAGWVLAAAFPERILPSPLLVTMIKAGRLGQKMAAGFYRYDGKRELDPAVEELLAPWIEPSAKKVDCSIADRLVLPMLIEAAHILEEGRVDDARVIDLAVLFGLGFPAQRGGLLWWADALGADRVLAKLQSLAALGPRAEPTPMLKSMAKAGRRFYDGTQHSA